MADPSKVGIEPDTSMWTREGTPMDSGYDEGCQGRAVKTPGWLDFLAVFLAVGVVGPVGFEPEHVHIQLQNNLLQMRIHIGSFRNRRICPQRCSRPSETASGS